MARFHKPGFLFASLISLVTLFTMAIPSSFAANTPSAGQAQSALTPSLSVSSNLSNRRYVASGDRAYDIGSEDARYPALGFHTRGEMGGIWTPPLKLLDGIWFGINDQWIGPATKFTSSYGNVQMTLPTTSGVQVNRTDFAPDGRRAVEFGLTLKSSSATEIKLNVDAHSELMGAYPWGFSKPDQTQANLPDTASFNGKQLVFQDNGTPPIPNASAHQWAAVVGASGLNPTVGMTGPAFRGPQDPPVICPVGSEPDKFRCDDTDYGKGAGGELTYTVKLPANSSQTVWFTVAGSDQGLASAQSEYKAASANPAAEFLKKIAGRLALDSRSQVSLPGDPTLAQAFAWSKQNLADLTQQANNIKIRPTEAGTAYPAPVGSLQSIRFEGAGFADYPWMFGTDQEYTMFALVGAGQFDTAKDGLRSLAAVSDIANKKSGKVVHEVVTDGSVYYGLNDEPGDIDETAKFPSSVALVWRWSGDNRFRDSLYDFSVRNMRYMASLSKDGLWPTGSGNVESDVLGPKAVDVAAYTIRGFYDLADMAASKHDTTTQKWATAEAQKREKAFQKAWWVPSIPQYADSLTADNQQLMERWWTGVTPMDAEMYINGQQQPGLAPADSANAALTLRETSCYSGEYGMYVEGAPGCDSGTYTKTKAQQAYTLNTAVMAVGLGNYGRLGPDQQKRYTDDLAELMLGSVAEQPGIMPEIGPSPDFKANVDQPFNERSSLEQAWGTYGVIWPIIHQQLGVDPQIGRGLLEVLPSVPSGQSKVAGNDIRIGNGRIDVEATHSGKTWTTVVRSHVSATLHVGATLPAGSKIQSVTLNGKKVAYKVRDTHAGRVTYVSTSGNATAQVQITTN